MPMQFESVRWPMHWVYRISLSSGLIITNILTVGDDRVLSSCSDNISLPTTIFCYTEEVLAEMLYGLCMACVGVLHFFANGKTARALVSASWYGHRCYRAYW